MWLKQFGFYVDKSILTLRFQSLSKLFSNYMTRNLYQTLNVM